MVCWLAVDKNGDEYIYEKKPLRSACGYWKIQPHEYEDRLSDTIELPKAASRNSSEESYLLPMSQLNLNRLNMDKFISVQ